MPPPKAFWGNATMKYAMKHQNFQKTNKPHPESINSDFGTITCGYCMFSWVMITLLVMCNVVLGLLCLQQIIKPFFFFFQKFQKQSL